MSRRSSRLQTLERNLKARRKTRAKARTLTVMRLEGDATRTQPSIRPVRLPKDIEDQIAVVRGRSVGKPSRGLLQLEERLLGTHDVEPTASATQRHNHGAQPAVAAMPAPHSYAAGLPEFLGGSTFSGRYNVESFEDTSAEISGEPVGFPITELSAGTPSSAVGLPKTVIHAGTAPRTDVSVGAVPWASEQSSRVEHKNALSQEQKEVADNFERDIAAMLGTSDTTANAPEDKQWDDTLRNATSTPPAKRTPAAGAPTHSAALKPDAHEVFNQMGLAMNYANSFDLGALDISARFDQFDKELSLTPKTAQTASAPIPVQALVLDDFDLVADLAEICGAQSPATPTAATPTNQPTTDPEATTPAAETRGRDHDEPPR